VRKNLNLGNSPSFHHVWPKLALGLCASVAAIGCATAGGPDGPWAGASNAPASDGGAPPAQDNSTPSPGANPGPGVGTPSPPGPNAGSSMPPTAYDGGAPSSVDAAVGAHAPDASPPHPTADARAPGVDGGYPAGWLYTNGAKVYKSNGGAPGTVWMGRGVNVDDIFFCGYNGALWMTAPEQALQGAVSTLMADWKPTFVRISLSMASNAKMASWLTSAPQYKTPMTNVINAIGAYPNVHVLVTLRSDGSMIGHDQADGDPEGTGIPSSASTTPSAGTYPTGTDATYAALVDTFANSGFVMFGLTNEPGGNKQSNATLASAMSHAVGTIRAEEDKLGVPHHVVSVQGNSWTSDISFYAKTPIPYDNVVYEIHGYPPATSSYTYSNIPVIIGEYGTLTNGNSAAFYADIEAKQIPNLAWDFEPYSDCAPDLLVANQSSTNASPTAWGSIVKSYLLAHP
jgi:Cellulase (glycosyl hydrolase family 5)